MPAISTRHIWLSSLPISGTLNIDPGASQALFRKSNLFAVGITSVTGSFNAFQCVEIREGERVVARGLVMYAAAEIRRIRGVKSEGIADVLGYVEAEYVVHRDNLVLVK